MMMDALESRLLMTVVFTVNTTADSGPGSLRTAILTANNASIPYSTEILFAIPGSGLHTIKPLSALPAITVQTDIEGTTDSAGNPLIELDGENAGAMANGLTFTRSTPSNTKPSVVTGLVINRFSGTGIEIDGSAPTDVYGCRIGTNAAGTQALGNGAGINLSNSNDQIGLAGSGAAFQTIISGNSQGGIGIGGNDNIIQNCLIGTDATGLQDLGNLQGGISIFGSNNLIGGTRAGQGNVVANTRIGIGGGSGISISAGEFNEILGNKIGMSADGKIRLDNQLGILIEGADDNFIGDGRDADGNLISANGDGGIIIDDGGDNNHILNNTIGLTPGLTILNGNNGDGVEIEDSSNNVINGNLINANNGDGVHIKSDGSATTGNSLSNDRIGIDTANEGEDQFFGNNGNGVNIDGATNTSITNCDIENNQSAGIEVNGSTANGNSFTANQIFNNQQLGISIGDNTGVEHPNHDPNFNGAGLPNDGINHPVLSSAVVTGNQTVITGSFAGADGSGYDIQIFTSDKADPSGFGQGQHFLTKATFVTLADGTGSFTVTYPGHLAAGQVITALADVGSSPTDTSEFSNAIPVSGAIISGNVFNDANGNGKQDGGEKILAKQTVFIDSNGNGLFDSASEISAITNSKGNYQLFGPPTGNVHVMLQVAAGFSQTVPKASRPYYKLDITPLGHFGGNIFGERKTTTASGLRPLSLITKTPDELSMLRELLSEF